MTEFQKAQSLRRVFDRDFVNNGNVSFRNKPITPTPLDGEISMETLFRHLTTTVTDKSTNQIGRAHV